MRAKVLSVIVILGALVYVFFFAMQQPHYGVPANEFTGLEQCSMAVGILLTLIGIIAVGYVSIQWIMR